jgi:signal transduction histidine kinase/CheY-like chemotaxis protein
MPSSESDPTPQRPRNTLEDRESSPENPPRTRPANSASDAEEYFSILARATNDAVRDWNVKEGTLAWPQGLESLLGYASPAATAKVGFWLNHIHPEDLERIQESLHQALAGSADHWTGEYRFQLADGHWIHIFERALILRCPDSRVISSMMDVTERKQLQTQVCRSQRMAAFGQLAGGVAHDFNNFLTTILGYSDLLLSEKVVRGQVASHVSEIRDAADRATALTNQLLAFSRRQALEPTVLEVNSLITNLERSLLRLLGENISIECHLHTLREGAHVKADAEQLAQIVINLGLNARDAMRQGGSLTIATSVLQVNAGEEPACSGGVFEPGEYVAIRLSDNGCGMTDEVKARLFEPFFTTKGTEDHSGLGLATTYGIVRQSGGYIAVESTLGEGTTFRIYLPRVGAPPPPAYKRRQSAKLLTGSETILVLEDEPSVRHLSVRVLRNLGYDVLEAAGGEDAKVLLARHGGRPIDLLLTDMVMPVISGRIFADWLSLTSPQTKVIYVSGYLEESMHPGDRRLPGMHFLPKPFSADQLATKVREALDAGR